MHNQPLKIANESIFFALNLSEEEDVKNDLLEYFNEKNVEAKEKEKIEELIKKRSDELFTIFKTDFLDKIHA